MALSPDTVLQYFSYIQNAYLGFFVPQYAVSLRKQEYNPKKFYAIDTGLQSAISFHVLDDVGKLFENLVFLELRRKYKELFYWEEDHEVDFIVKTGERVHALVNACVSIADPEVRKREITALMSCMHALGKDESFLVLMKGKSQVIETEGGRIVVLNLEGVGAI